MVVVDGGLGATPPAQLELLRTGRRGQHPGIHRHRQVDRGQAHPARGAQYDNPFPLFDFGYRPQSVISGAVGDAERRGRGEVRVIGYLRDGRRVEQRLFGERPDGCAGEDALARPKPHAFADG